PKQPRPIHPKAKQAINVRPISNTCNHEQQHPVANQPIHDQQQPVANQPIPNQPKLTKQNLEHRQKSYPERLGFNDRDGRRTTYFVTNFPDSVNVADLWSSLTRHWKVGEIYIPVKRDKYGKRFAFVRFEDVNDVEALLKKIEGTWFGFYKLRANISRFTKGGEANSGGQNQNAIGRVGETATAREGIRNGVSFKEAMGGAVDKNQTKAQNKTNTGASSRMVKGQLTKTYKNYLDNILKVEAVPDNVEKLKHCYVGTLWEAKEAGKIHMLILMEGFQDIQATILGIDKILLSSSIEGGMKRAFEANKQWWETKFSDIKAWSTIQKPRGRRIWVRIFGAPPHAWGWECFNRIVWRFGRLLQLDNQTERQQRLDVARAQIAVTSWDFVDEVLDINVNDELFVIRIMEERFGEIDLGVTRQTDSQVYTEDSMVDESCSEVDGGVIIAAALYHNGELDGVGDDGEAFTTASGHVGEMNGEGDGVWHEHDSGEEF
ncbi:RNA recognition motif, partial [Trifolium medium]|nr:RNA recognition motif [Trifolium medium]